MLERFWEASNKEINIRFDTPSSPKKNLFSKAQKASLIIADVSNAKIVFT
jgi:hypothetical protein